MNEPAIEQMILYETPTAGVQIEVRVDRETVWLNQQQMTELFGRDRSVITKHIRNIYKEGELEESSTCAKFTQVQTEGNRTVTREIDSYNLDVIISVGYRVKSIQGTRFRQWATGVLRQHLLTGYTLNDRRLAERGIQEAQQALELLARTLQNQNLVNPSGSDAIDLIVGYAQTWRWLVEYDEDRLALPVTLRPSSSALHLQQVTAGIANLKAELIARNEATPLFGQTRGDALIGILGSIEQTWEGEFLYPSREEKAAHLLYFIVKDHPFTDGNKRIGSLLFLLYLQQEGINCPDPQTVAALTLLIAESAPSNKDLMVRLTVNLLADS
jgi:prophage maintenance system killer protein